MCWFHSIYHFQMLVNSHVKWDVKINKWNPQPLFPRRLNQIFAKIPLKPGKSKNPFLLWNALFCMRTQQSQQVDVISDCKWRHIPRQLLIATIAKATLCYAEIPSSISHTEMTKTTEKHRENKLSRDTPHLTAILWLPLSKVRSNFRITETKTEHKSLTC